MTLAGIELRYLVNQISETVRDYYVSNIYGITKDSILFKLHHTDKDDVFMMISTFGIWLTSVKVDQIEPNRLQKRLRSDLLRLKLKKIEQIGAERIAYLTFSGFDKEFIMVGEFFGDGNIILCNEKMKILALQHSIDVRHRKLGVGLEYIPPPESGLDIFRLEETDFGGLRETNLSAAKWLGRTLGLPKKYVEGIFDIAQVNPKTVGNLLQDDMIRQVYHTTREVISDVVEGRHHPVIMREISDVIPVNLGDVSRGGTPAESFIAGLDTMFTEDMLEKGRAVRSGGSEKKIKELESQLSEQQKAINTVKEKSASITGVANLLYQMISGGITSIEDDRAQNTLRGSNTVLKNEKGISLLVIDGIKIQINTQASLQSIASALFNEAKRQSHAVGSIEQIMEKTRKKLGGIKSKSSAEGAISVSEIRKKSWYERYRWFFTTDNILAIGGRDAASNSAVVRKRLEKNDRIFHADIFGSPFFILKGGQDAPVFSMNEIAHATVCFSRAWREGMYGLSAYWVRPEQVKKSAPSGQFLPKGSFTIEGQRNFIKVHSLKLAVGILRQHDDYVLTCGPPEPIIKNSVYYAIIEPDGMEMADAAKKIRMEFLKLGDIAKKIPVDDFVRVLPAGKSQIKEIGMGSA